MVKKLKVNQLSPDGYSRFFILADILRDMYTSHGKTIKILDVGGGSEYMQQQLQEAGIPYELTVTDILERPAGMTVTYIQGDATNMAFEDNAYDVIISTDTLEHIPRDRKQAFLDECLRVAAELCIIAAPFETEGVNDAEIAVNEFNKKLFGKGQDWLEEHLEFGKPTRKMFQDTLKRKKIEYDEFGTQNIATWLLNTHLNLIDAKLGLTASDHVKANQFYNQNILSMNEFTEPTYRHFFIMYTGGNKVKRFNLARYQNSEVDYAKMASYTSQLLSLVAERLAELQGQNTTLKSKTMKAEAAAHEATVRQHELQAIVASQQHTLNRLAPLLKVLRSRPVKRIHSSVKGKRR